MNDGESAEINQHQETKIARFTGNKTETTPPVTIQGKWELQWTAEGILGITLYDLYATKTQPAYCTPGTFHARRNGFT